ncbi:MAG: carboxypeptidase-like regulatory domain-containing protein [Tannerella sp.]|jgi:hypothetical protein|nr:carboxypeptidase-like regulatory domain-containing protein [Tannerella sp.]
MKKYQCIKNACSKIGRVAKLATVMILTGIVYASASSYAHEVETEGKTLYSVATPPAAVQQGRQITGTVTDTNGEPIIGANVVEKGTTNGLIRSKDLCGKRQEAGCGIKHGNSIQTIW